MTGILSIQSPDENPQQNITSIPIQFVGTHQEAPNAFNMHPCVPVMVAKSQSSLTAEPSFATEVMALVDTGADYLYCDIGFAISLGLEPVGTTDVNAGLLMPIFMGAFQIVGTSFPIVTRLVGQDFAGRSAPYQIVLGRLLLNAMHLEYAPSSGRCVLHIPDFQSPEGLHGSSS